MITHQVSRMNQSIRQLIWVGLLSLLFAACSPTGGGFTPEDAVRKTHSSSDIEITSVHRIDNGAVVLYQKVQPDFDPGNPDNPSSQFGFNYVDLQNGRWWARSGRGGAYTPERGSNIILVITRVKTKNPVPGNSSLADDPTAPLIIYGKVLDQQIAAVKLLTHDHQEIQDTIAGSMFGILARPEVIPCTLHLLDTQGNVVEPIDLTDLPEWQIPPALRAAAEKSCPALDVAAP